jgi:tetratricopeptide (TPR) repeat protein
MAELSVRQLLELAQRQHVAGRLAEAAGMYRQILSVVPNDANALNLLGVLEFQLGRLDAARQLLNRAVGVAPGTPNFRNNLGQVLAAQGQTEAAIAQYRQAIAVWSTYPEAWNNLGCALQASNQIIEAESSFRRALELRPDYPEGHYNLGNVLRDSGRLEPAIDSFRRAIALRPNYSDAIGNLGNALHFVGRYDEAVQHYLSALSINAQNPSAHYNLGTTLLLRSDFEQGWAHYEWRRRVPAVAGMFRDFPQPRWDGKDLQGKRILIHPEQGLGDAIQFARFLPMVAQLNGRVILQCHRELLRLFAPMSGIHRIVITDEPVPEFDVHCPMLSLPLALGTTIGTIPSAVPYVQADEHGSARWRERLGAGDGRLRVGLVWAGSPLHPNDRNRSMTLDMLLDALKKSSSSVRFVSLQKGPGAVQARQYPAIADWNTEFIDFAETAALIDNLDLVISIDTAVVHLAGAMGKPVWVLLPFVPDWRWMLDRTDSPWYPTMKLFRQPRAGDWSAPLAQVAQELRGLK